MSSLLPNNRHSDPSSEATAAQGKLVPTTWETIMGYLQIQVKEKFPPNEPLNEMLHKTEKSHFLGTVKPTNCHSEISKCDYLIFFPLPKIETLR